MSSARNWSLFLGHWGGVSVRGHISVALVGLLILAITSRLPTANHVAPIASGANTEAQSPVASSEAPTADINSSETQAKEKRADDTPLPAKASDVLAISGMALVVYLLSVVLHIAAHVAAARRCGTRVSEITIGPWGELDSLELPRDHEHALHVLIAGLGANLIVGICGMLAAAQFPGFTPASLLHLLDGSQLFNGETVFIACKWTILVNLVLAGLNLIPFFPFDAAFGALRIVQWVDPQVDRVRWQKVVSFVGRLAGIACLCIAPLVVVADTPYIVAPVWLLATLGLILFFSPAESDPLWTTISESTRIQTSMGVTAARVSPPRSESPGGGVGDGLSTALRRMSEAATVLSPEEQARQDDERMDDILAKLHERGMSALSVDEQDTLRRVSQRYKNKRPSK
jgi:Zn-dependent protease